MSKTALIIGSGLGGLATALRLEKRGYSVTILEKHSTPGGRLNTLEQDGFTFDLGPSFFSMSYEFKELFDDIGVPIPFELNELNPLYTVFIEGREKTYKIYKDLDKLAAEFSTIEPDFKKNIEKYLLGAGQLFHDTEYKIIKRNFNSLWSYMLSMATVPKKHLPKMFRTFWGELERYFKSEDVKIIFSLVAFFLGATPFNTPAVYNLLNYTELKHDGYWNVKGGMYSIVKGMLQLFTTRNISLHCHTEVTEIISENKQIQGFKDQNGKLWQASIYVVNADAAAFRGKMLQRKKYTEAKLDKMDWTLAPFTIYLGVKGKIPGIEHHNYFLGKNFRGYADTIFRSSVAPEKPYYYVNVASKSNPNCAPPDCENIFILCPVPDLRIKPNWDDAEKLTKEIIEDLGNRVGYDIKNNILTQAVYTPLEWESMFSLYRGSGLGLAHGLNQIGALRPANKDEVFPNLYYVGASTHPGTGLPIVVIGSKLVTERIENEHRTV